MKVFFKVFGAIFAVVLSSTAAFGQLHSDLSLSASGTITSTPFWQVGGATATTATFAFGGAAVGSGQNVDSGALQLNIVHSGVTTSQDVELTAPSGCHIGPQPAGNIAQPDVKLVFAGTEATGATVPFTPGTAQSTKLRFKSNYGLLTGAVACGTAGTLVYNY